MTMQPDRIDALRQNIVDILKELQLDTMALEAYDKGDYDTDVEYLTAKLHWAEVQLEQKFATYLEGADILPEKRPKRKVKNELDSIADYVDQGFNQAIDTTAANLASVIKSLRGTK
jgi:citrate lyase gamma subunit